MPTTILTYHLDSPTRHGELQVISEIKQALGKAILHHPAISEKIEADPDLKHLRNLYYEADVLENHLRAVPD